MTSFVLARFKNKTVEARVAHFARIENGVVVQVIVVHDNDAPTEAAGLAFLERLYGPGITWKQTSYNTRRGVHNQGRQPFRKNYAGVGYSYDEARDAFIPPNPHSSWLLDEGEGIYKAPVTYPNDGGDYTWNEVTQAWVKVR